MGRTKIRRPGRKKNEDIRIRVNNRKQNDDKQKKNALYSQNGLFSLIYSAHLVLGSTVHLTQSSHIFVLNNVLAM